VITNYRKEEKMLNSLRSTPRIVGTVHLPEISRTRALIGKQVMLKLPELVPGDALEIEFGDKEDLRVGRKQILQACGIVYGWGRVKTSSIEDHLYVWLLPEEIDFANTVKTHRFGEKTEVNNA
jgi:hypothetical protein